MSDIPPAQPPATPPATGTPPPAPTTPPAQPPAPAPTQQPPAQPPATAEPTPTGDPAALGDPGKKALQAERDARAAAEQEAAALKAQLTEIEDKDKTELQKLAEANTGLTAQAAEAGKLRAAMAAAPQGMSPQQILELAPRLQGSTDAELQADAAKLFAQFAGQADPNQQQQPPAGSPGPGLPVEVSQLQPGAPQPGNGPTLDQQIQEAEQKGEWATAMRLKSQKMVEMQANRPAT